MKRIAVFAILCMLLPAVTAGPGVAAGDRGSVSYGRFLADLVDAYENGTDASRIDQDVEALGDACARSIAEHWKKVYLNKDYQMFLYGRDDPSVLPITGSHAFVVLGYELENGEMTEELKGRCRAAAAAAKAFPDSVLVCSGGATGKHNPERHTEAGLMKEYLSNVCGIDESRIHTDERALSTDENAVNTMEILRRLGIETMTIVTSSYHQRWGQVLYHAAAVRYREKYQYSVEIIGNYSYDTAPSNPLFLQDARYAVYQLGKILRLSQAQMNLLPQVDRTRR